MDPRFAFEFGSSLCLQITVLVLATFVLQRWIGDARWGCRLWTACFVCIIALVAAGLLLPHRRLFDFPSGFSRQSLLSIVTWQGRIALTLASVWGIGFAISLFRRVVTCIKLTVFLRNCCESLDTEALLNRVNIDINDPPNLAILSSDRVQGPFCWQLHQPVIILPAFLLAEDEATLQHVLLHELEHLHTQHPMQHFLQGVCSMLFWFHPSVWSAARGAELNREYLCDEVAAKKAGKFSAYLRTLATIAERCGNVSCTEAPQGTLAFGNQNSALIRRSKRLVQLAEGNRSPSRWRPVLGLAALFICAMVIQQVWLPTNAMASERSGWSPWPSWTADALHQLNIQVRDFESFEDRVQMHELLYEDD